MAPDAHVSSFFDVVLTARRASTAGLAVRRLLVSPEQQVEDVSLCVRSDDGFLLGKRSYSRDRGAGSSTKLPRGGAAHSCKGTALAHPGGKCY